jgi:hypothetical protein
MNIALDYDGTYTLDPLFWDWFIGKSSVAGHTVFIVTARSEILDKNETLRRLHREGVRVIYCDGVAKKHVLLMLAQHEPNIKIDVWIDDRPESVTQNSSASLDQLSEWRRTRT